MAFLLLCKQAKTKAAPLFFLSSNSRLISSSSSSSYNQTPSSEFAFRRFVSGIPRASLHEEAHRAITRNFCCLGEGQVTRPPVDGDGDEAVTPAQRDGDEAVTPAQLEFEGPVIITDDDLASDESLWKLYDKWCIHFSVSRTPAEKQKRFQIFKDKVFKAHKRDWGLYEYDDLTYEEDPRFGKLMYFPEPDQVVEFNEEEFREIFERARIKGELIMKQDGDAWKESTLP